MTPSSTQVDIRKRIDSFALAISVIGLVGTWWYVLEFSSTNLFVLYTMPALVVFNLWAALAVLSQSAGLAKFERLVFYVLYGYAVAALASRFVLPLHGQSSVGSLQMFFVLLVVAASGLVLPPRAALVTSSVLFALDVSSTWAYLLTVRAPPSERLLHLVEQSLALAVIALMLTLAWLKVWWNEADEARGHMSRLAHSDPLTNLPNRRGMYEVVERAFARTPTVGFCVALADIDGFKSVNDNYGHAQGDEVLRRFANVLRAELRERDTVGRWGGEEFLIVLPDATLRGAAAIAERLRRSAAIAALLPTANRPITASFGVARWRSEDTFESLLVRADEALYRAKSAGKNRVATEESATS
ncbi:GGDEF domain-containing protein [Deinococcus yavapaiensis]|uniref:Diguanylate cyclase (GGDEF)-like protein n=1 Tax=Deinococcus yavapaiensis KR-236 TaxID=694435 RepID=A0A318S686_9DEIO|nr:GGDEF domain-containing protein [Deinococcus yavapaiensis]PYE54183.1 diguanylate cyclase (GGDEF)-like protein [Deinococcus yavapaiensis KR-236]